MVVVVLLLFYSFIVFIYLFFALHVHFTLCYVSTFRLDFIDYTSLISREAGFHDKTLIYMHKIPIDIFLVCFLKIELRLFPNVCDHLFSNIVIPILLLTKLYFIFYRPCLYVIWLIMEISHGAGLTWRRKPSPRIKGVITGHGDGVVY